MGSILSQSWIFFIAFLHHSESILKKWVWKGSDPPPRQCEFLHIFFLFDHSPKKIPTLYFVQGDRVFVREEKLFSTRVIPAISNLCQWKNSGFVKRWFQSLSITIKVFYCVLKRYLGPSLMTANYLGGILNALGEIIFLENCISFSSLLSVWNYKWQISWEEIDIFHCKFSLHPRQVE